MFRADRAMTVVAEDTPISRIPSHLQFIRVKQPLSPFSTEIALDMRLFEAHDQGSAITRNSRVYLKRPGIDSTRKIQGVLKTLLL